MPLARERARWRYRIVYEVTPDTGHHTTAGDVTVLRIFGPGQDHTDPQEG